MKSLFIVLFALTSFPALAAGGKDSDGLPMPPSRPSEVIYEAMQVPAVDVTDGRLGAQTLQKYISGLNCQKITAVVPHPMPHYSCSLALENRNDADIYNGLDIPEVDVTPPGMQDEMIFQKEVVALTCKRFVSTMPNGPALSYRCTAD